MSVLVDSTVFDTKPSRPKSSTPKNTAAMGNPPKYSLVGKDGTVWSVRTLSEFLSTYDGRNNYPPEMRTKMYAKIKATIKTGKSVFSYYGLSFDLVIL